MTELLNNFSPLVHKQKKINTKVISRTLIDQCKFTFLYIYFFDENASYEKEYFDIFDKEDFINECNKKKGKGKKYF